MRQGNSGLKEVSEKSWGTNGHTPTPPPAGCCLNPGVFWEPSPQCWLTKTILSASISSISHWRVPIQCSPLLLGCDLCHLPIYRTVSGQFLSWKVSLHLFHSPSPAPSLPLTFSSPLRSVLLCLMPLKSNGKITALTQCGHNSQDWIIFPTFIMYGGVFLSSSLSSTLSSTDQECAGPDW